MKHHTSEALRCGTCCRGISQFYLHTHIRMSHTCLCYRWYWFTDPGGMEGWVVLGGWLRSETECYVLQCTAVTQRSVTPVRSQCQVLLHDCLWTCLSLPMTFTSVFQSVLGLYQSCRGVSACTARYLYIISVCLSVYLCVCPSVCLSVCLSVRLSVCPSVCQLWYCVYINALITLRAKLSGTVYCYRTCL